MRRLSTWALPSGSQPSGRRRREAVGTDSAGNQRTLMWDSVAEGSPRPSTIEQRAQRAGTPTGRGVLGRIVRTQFPSRSHPEGCLTDDAPVQVWWRAPGLFRTAQPAASCGLLLNHHTRLIVILVGLRCIVTRLLAPQLAQHATLASPPPQPYHGDRACALGTRGVMGYQDGKFLSNKLFILPPCMQPSTPTPSRSSGLVVPYPRPQVLDGRSVCVCNITVTKKCRQGLGVYLLCFWNR